jgi:hypothetical protein
LLDEKIYGIQILNGSNDKIFKDSINIWINILLKGKKKYIYAGNDAHGNFNIYRQIKIPMINLLEKNEQLFGEYRTGVIVDERNIDNTINNLKKGNCFITNGPFINIQAIYDDSNYSMGSSFIAETCSISIKIISTPEFGKIKKVYLIKGNIGYKEEEYFVIDNLYEYNYSNLFDIYNLHNCYFRCKVILEDSDKFAMTNPIWIKNK